MDNEKITGIRYILTLGKVQVTKVEKGLSGQRIHVDFGNSIIGKFEAPANADVKLGDKLTLYTEVLTNAFADKPSVN